MLLERRIYTGLNLLAIGNSSIQLDQVPECSTVVLCCVVVGVVTKSKLLPQELSFGFFNFTFVQYNGVHTFDMQYLTLVFIKAYSNIPTDLCSTHI